MAHSDKIKWSRKTGGSGAFTMSLAPYHTDYTINCIVLTLTSGSPSTIKIGWTLGADDVAWETDISFIKKNVPICLELQQPPPPAKDTLYVDLGSGTLTLDVLLVQMIGA